VISRHRNLVIRHGARKLALLSPNSGEAGSPVNLQIWRDEPKGMADRIGRTRAALYAMLTLPMTGETAGELGLASFVVPGEEVESKALDLVQELPTARRPGMPQCGRSSRCGHQVASQGPTR
jgi:hypothetical protein